MRAAIVDEAHAALTVEEEHHVLTVEPDRHDAALSELLHRRDRLPIVPEELSNRRPGTDASERSFSSAVNMCLRLLLKYFF